MPGVLTIDIGTGSIKASVFDDRLQAIAIASRPWSPASRAFSSRNFDTAEAWASVIEVVREAIDRSNLTADRLHAVAVASIRSGFVLLDADRTVVWACWSLDRRAESTVATMRAASPRLERGEYAATGQSAEMSAVPRLLWLKENRPHDLERAHHVLPISEWVAVSLGGEIVAEQAIMSTLGLVDLRKKQARTDALRTWELNDSLVPPLVEAGTVVGKVDHRSAEVTGLAPGTPIVSAGADTQLAALALAATESTNKAIVVGGSHWQQLQVVEDVADPAGRVRVSCHVVPPHLVAEALSLNAGVAVQWLIDLLGVDSSILFAEAAGRPPGSGGLIATVATSMNYLSWTHPIGGIVGLDFSAGAPDRGMLVRCFLEHAALTTTANLSVLEAATGEDIHEVVMGGGASRNPAWVQMVADASGRRVHVPAMEEATLRGAALCAATGARWFGSLAEAASLPVRSSATEPIPANVEAYEEVRCRWEEVDLSQRQLSRSWRRPGTE